jgi:hypothetical protein
MINRYPRLIFPLGGVLLMVAYGCSGGSDFDLSGASASSSSAGAGGGDGGSGGDGGGGGGDVPLEKFSFFVTSLKAMRELSGSQLGFGGDLRFGETGLGAGLRGADKICSAVAEMSMPGSAKKEWHAFLSAVAGEDGKQVNAIDRIGEGPWYDRLGRLVANTKADLLHDRPVGADPAIKNDLPNEDGVPNHQPDPTKPQEDNHHTLTGSNNQGALFSATATCLDWTSAKGDPPNEGRPRCGLSWPRMNGGMIGMGESANWISSLLETGCAPGVNLVPTPPPGPEDVDVGNGGGYGQIYCFAKTP